MDITTITITSVITLIITVLGGLAVEYLRRIKPKIEYSTNEGIAIELDEKTIGASIIEVSNPSSKAVKDIVVKIKSPHASVKNGGIKASPGLEYTAKEEGDTISISIPFLKYKDFVSATIISEGRLLSLSSPEISIRSPDAYKLVHLNERGNEKSIWHRATTSLLGPAAVAASVVGFSLSTQGGSIILNARVDQSANLVLSSAMAGLPEVAANYTTTTGVNYYNQGPYIYALAVKSSSREERIRLRNMLSNVLDISGRINSSSKSALCFFAGKISDLLGEPAEASKWYEQSKSENSSEYKFLIENFKDSATKNSPT